jgi:hypothetical protein
MLTNIQHAAAAPKALHTDAWYRRQNAALGLPPGARHSDAWYKQKIQQKQQKAAQEEQWRLERLAKEQANQAYNQQQGSQQAAAEAERIQREKEAAAQAAALKAQQDAAAAAAQHQTDQRHRRDEWDRLNQQGIYDADGWQSIGYQPDPKPIPDWWLTGPSAPPAAPPVPPAAPPAGTPWASPAPGNGSVPPGYHNPEEGWRDPAKWGVSKPGDLLARPEPTGAPFAGLTPPAPGDLLARPQPTGAPFAGLTATKSGTGLWGSSQPQAWTQPKPLNNWGVWGQKATGTWGK